MRFCPVLDHKPRPRTLKEFEAACKLEDGSWPGTLPNGKDKWLMRWRGQDEDGMGGWQARKSDDVQQEVGFEVGNDGKVKFKAV